MKDSNKNTIGDIFNLEDVNLEPPKLTKDEFIDKTRDLIKLILDKYNENWEDSEDINDEDTEPCVRCNGFLHIEQGGDVVDCPSCDGTGLNIEKVFDFKSFGKGMEDVIYEDEKFFELLECEIIDNKDEKGKLI